MPNLTSIDECVGIFKNRKPYLKDRDGIRVDISQPSLEYQKNRGNYIYKTTPAELSSNENPLEFKLTIFNDRREDVVSLKKAEILDASSSASIFYEEVEIQPKRKYEGMTVRYEVDDSVPSSYQIPLAILLNVSDRKIIICRTITIFIKDDVSIDNEKTCESPFTNIQWKNVEIVNKVNQQYDDLYPIPNYLHILRSEIRPKDLKKINYRQYFHYCLWIEEIAAVDNLKRFNMENIKMSVDENDDLLYFTVPGLNEKRPNLTCGDKILIKITDAAIGYEGLINMIREECVYVEEIPAEVLDLVDSNGDINFDVSFQLGRLILERSHKAIDNICGKRVVERLFPSLLIDNNDISGSTDPIDNISFFNKDITENPEQMSAVENILKCSSGKYPYIIIGPPGTGKSETIVEAIRQITKLTKKRILLCAHSNAACDMLALKLIPFFRTSELIRINSRSREITNLQDDLQQFCNIDENNRNLYSVDGVGLAQYKIVVATLSLIGKYSDDGSYKPDVLFVDEASQASEPDTCMALSVMKTNAQIVLAGDPYQLGPIVLSSISKDYGLDTSLMERLIEFDIYKKLTDSKFLTLLRRNFRNHKTILKIPNELFYFSSLVASSRRFLEYLTETNIFPLINHENDSFPNNGNAIEFISVSSEENTQGKTPSFFNRLEAEVVMKCVRVLVARLQVEQDEIGIITPYARQVHKLKSLLSTEFPSIEVGTVENFQGREKQVIIVSTVRAQHDHLKYDWEYSLGFVKDPKRFNVTLTRAISKQIVIGCPLVLSTNQNWTMYMDQCKELNSYYGAKFELRSEQRMMDIRDRFVETNMSRLQI